MGIDSKTLALAKSAYKGIINVGINNITNENNVLTFLMRDGTSKSVTVNGLSDNNYTTIEKNKINSIDEKILSKFTYVNNQLLFNNIPVDKEIDLSSYATISIVDNKLLGKANLYHNHTISNINGLQTILDDRYTKVETLSKIEINALINSISKGMNWKDSVLTLNDLPLIDNKQTDTRIVEETSHIYVWNSTQWIDIGNGINIPLVTELIDGQMSKEDKIKLNSIIVDNLVTIVQLNNSLNSKVDKDGIKVLSQNDYSTLDKNKVNKIITNGVGQTFLADDGNYKNIMLDKSYFINDDVASEDHTYSSNRINEIIGNPNDLTLPIDLQGKSIVDMVKTNFTKANDAKTEIINVIGDSSLAINNTFSQIANSLLIKKQDIVTALMDKGVVAEDTDDIDNYAYSISQIKNGGSNSLHVTKLNLAASSTHQEVLTNTISLNELATSVLKFIPGAAGLLEYTCAFNNANSSNFAYPNTVVFDGTMHLVDKTVVKDTNADTVFANGTISTNDINASDFYNVNNIVVDDVNSKYTITGTNNPVAVLSNGDINLNGILNLSSINWVSSLSGNGILKLAISVDKGITWKCFNGTTWNVINVNVLNDFKVNGMNATTVNSLTKDNLELLRNGSNTIRFAYYIEKLDITDISNNDNIELKVDMQGTDSIAPQANFSYKLENDMKTITYTINIAGTYTFIYADKI